MQIANFDAVLLCSAFSINRGNARGEKIARVYETEPRRNGKRIGQEKKKWVVAVSSRLPLSYIILHNLSPVQSCIKQIKSTGAFIIYHLYQHFRFWMRTVVRRQTSREMHITRRIDRRALIFPVEREKKNSLGPDSFRFDVEISCSVILTDRNGPLNGSLGELKKNRPYTRSSDFFFLQVRLPNHLQTPPVETQKAFSPFPHFSSLTLTLFSPLYSTLYPPTPTLYPPSFPRRFSFPRILLFFYPRFSIQKQTLS